MVYIACKGNHSKIFDRFEQARKAQQIQQITETDLQRMSLTLNIDHASTKVTSFSTRTSE